MDEEPKPMLVEGARFEELKTKYSVVSPELEASHYKPIVQQIKDIIELEYGGFLPPQTLERVEGLEDRIIITNREGFLKIWNDSSQGRRGRQLEPHAFTLLPEGVMVFAYEESAWEDFVPEQTRGGLLELYGGANEQALKDYYAAIALSYTVIHEVLHQFHHKRLPEYFAEYGIPFYQNIIAGKMGLPEINTPEANRDEYLMARTYSYLMEHFGSEAIHKIFFLGPESGVDIHTMEVVLGAVEDTAKKHNPDLIPPK